MHPLAKRVRDEMHALKGRDLHNLFGSIATMFDINYHDFDIYEHAFALLRPRTNLRFSVVQTSEERRVSLIADNATFVAPTEAQAIVMCAIQQRTGPTPKKRKRTFNHVRFSEALKESGRPKSSYNRKDPNGDRRHGFTIDYLGIVFEYVFPLITYDSNYVPNGEKPVGLRVLVKTDPEEKWDYENPKGIEVGKDGVWFDDGPWITLADSIMDDLEAENTVAKQEKVQIKAIEATKRQADLDAELRRASEILLTGVDPEKKEVSENRINVLGDIVITSSVSVNTFGRPEKQPHEKLSSVKARMRKLIGNQ
jgi:hypothetical protein